MIGQLSIECRSQVVFQAHHCARKKDSLSRAPFLKKMNYRQEIFYAITYSSVHIMTPTIFQRVRKVCKDEKRIIGKEVHFQIPTQ